MEKGFIKFTKLREDAKLPVRELPNAGFDIYVCFDEDYRVIESHSTELLPTGIASVISKGMYMQVQERGSSGSKGIKYSAGVIDSNYRGEWFLAVTNTNTKPIIIIKDRVYNSLDDVAKGIINKGYVVYSYEKALFQGILHRVYDVDVTEIKNEELLNEQTTRGVGKLGSSGN